MSSTRHEALRWVLVPEAAREGMAAGHFVMLDRDKLKHLRKVLRMEWDEPLRVLDGQGRLYEGRLEKKGEDGGVRLETLVTQQSAREELELVICLPKNSTMDWIVEKAVECGASQVTAVVSSRSVVKPERESGDKYVRRWQAIMDGAVEQSERLWRPEVGQPALWKDWLAKLDPKPSFAFVSEIRGQGDAALAETWRKLHEAPPKAGIRILIGPEGGLSDSERHDLRQSGFVELSLGAAVLRVETAVVSALTLARVSRLISTT